MVLTDKIQINRPAGEVWRCIQDPLLMKEWNHNIVAVVRVSTGDASEGHQYRVRYKILGREGNFLAEFMEYQKPVKLLIHLTGGDLPVKGYIQEIYELSENSTGTLLRQRIEFHNVGVNIFSLCLLILGHSIGRISGGGKLRGLKEFAEASA